MRLTRLLAGAALGALALPAFAADYTIGVSNTVQGNGWREEMICAIKAQALASGEVKALNIAHRNTDAAGQSEDIRNLISAKVNAIVVNPADPAGIAAAVKEATDAGIVVVAVDQAVNEPSAYIISNGTGGPAGMTNFITVYLYKRGFSDGQMGYAAAIAWVLLVVVAVIAFILFRTQRSWVHYSGDDK